MQDSREHNDHQLLKEASTGNEQAFAGLFHLYKHKLYSFLIRITESPEMTEDIIQDIFLRLWKDKTDLVNIENFGAYLFKMGQNQAINAFKRMARETVILSELRNNTGSIQQQDNLSLGELQQKLQTAFDKLSPQQKLVYTLSREQGLKHDEIARQLNISPSTVNNHMILALRIIREQLAQYMNTPGWAGLAITLFTLIEKKG